MQHRRFLNAVLAALLLTLSACATSTPGELECETDDQCPAGQACDTAEGICVRASITTNNENNISPNGSPNSSPNNIPRPNNDADMGGDAGGEEDMADPCNGMCSGNEVCSAGECVPECMPACEDYEQCTANGCVIPDCGAAGDACDLTNPDQGEFACVDIEEPYGLCLTKCDNPYTVDRCGASEYCWEFGGSNVCLPDLCDANSDCTSGGTCVDWDNDFSTCFRAGSLAEGAACDPTDSQCEQGTFCRETTSETTGVCSAICNPWAADPGCDTANGEYCGEPLSTRYWLCSDDTDPGPRRHPGTRAAHRARFAGTRRVASASANLMHVWRTADQERTTVLASSVHRTVRRSVTATSSPV